MEQSKSKAVPLQPAGKVLGYVILLSCLFALGPLIKLYFWGYLPDLSKAISGHLPRWLINGEAIFGLPLATLIFLKNLKALAAKLAFGVAVIAIALFPASFIQITQAQEDRYFWWWGIWILIHSYLYLWPPGSKEKGLA